MALTRREWREQVARDGGAGLGEAMRTVAREVADKPTLDWDVEQHTAEDWQELVDAEARAHRPMSWPAPLGG